MVNIVGYKVVFEVFNNFGCFLIGQVIVVGKILFCKVFVIGVGVVGLSVIVIVRRFGVIVCGFDIWFVVREQVQLFGVEFIEVEIEEDGFGVGGYVKEMLKEFIEVEMKFFIE